MSGRITIRTIEGRTKVPPMTEARYREQVAKLAAAGIRVPRTGDRRRRQRWRLAVTFTVFFTSLFLAMAVGPPGWVTTIAAVVYLAATWRLVHLLNRLEQES